MKSWRVVIETEETTVTTTLEERLVTRVLEEVMQTFGIDHSCVIYVEIEEMVG